MENSEFVDYNRGNDVVLLDAANGWFGAKDQAHKMQHTGRQCGVTKGLDGDSIDQA